MTPINVTAAELERISEKLGPVDAALVREAARVIAAFAKARGKP